MIWAIILTFIITVLGMAVMHLRGDNARIEHENCRLQREVTRLTGQVSDCLGNEQRRRERDAYGRGLYDGRKTDTLYRSVLKRYSSGEQITVMTDGERAGSRKGYYDEYNR